MKINKILLILVLLFLPFTAFAGEPKIISVAINPPNPGFGDLVEVTVSMCANKFMDTYLAMAFSNTSTAHAPGTSGQVFVVDTNGVDVKDVTLPINMGYLAAAIDVAAVNDCTDCGSETSARTITRVFNVHVPPAHSFDSCNPSALYLHVGLKTTQMMIADWAGLTACAVSKTAMPIPVLPAGFNIASSYEGVLQVAGDKILFSADYDYANGAGFNITDSMPAGFTLEAYGPTSIPGGLVQAPSIGAMSGSFTWTFPSRVGVPGEAQGAVWMLLSATGSPSGSYTNTATGNMSGQSTKNSSVTITTGQAAISIKKTQNADSFMTGDTVTYTVSYDVNGYTLKNFQAFDGNTLGAYSGGLAPAGWRSLMESGVYGTWTVQDPCNTGDRFVTGSSTQYPGLLLDDGNTLNASDQFCEGMIVSDFRIEPTTIFPGADAQILFRNNGQSGVAGVSYGIVSSIDNAPSPGYLMIQKCAGGCTYPAGGLPSIGATVAGKWYRVRINVTNSGGGQLIQARVWARGDPEPSVWDINYTDATALSNADTNCTGTGTWTDWRPGVNENSGDYDDVRDSYDNFAVYEPRVADSAYIWDTVPTGITYLGCNGCVFTNPVTWSIGSVSQQSGSMTWWGRVNGCSPVSNQAMIGSAGNADVGSNWVIADVYCWSPTFTPTVTETITESMTATLVSGTYTFTRTVTPTLTAIPTATVTRTLSNTITRTATVVVPTGTYTHSFTVTRTITIGAPSPTNTFTTTWTHTVSGGTPTFTWTAVMPVATESDCVHRDAAFGGDGIVQSKMALDDLGRDVAVDDNNKILVSGYSATNEMTLWRYNQDGSLDTSLGGTGYVYITPIYINDKTSMVLDSSNRIVVSGVNSSNYLTVYRLNNNGGLDTTFNGSGYVTSASSLNMLGYGTKTVIDPSARIVVLANYNTGGPRATVWRFNSDGTVDTTLNVTGTASVVNSFGYTAATDSSGKIIIAGTDCTNVANQDMGIWRLNADGSLDTTFNGTGHVIHNSAAGGNAYDAARAVSVDAAGRIVVAGTSEDTNGRDDLVLWRYNSDGTPDTSFNGMGYIVFTNPTGGGSDYIVTDMELAGNSIYVTGGSTDSTGIIPDMVVFKFNAGNGTLDTTFNGTGYVIMNNVCGGNGSDVGHGIYTAGSGEIYVTGSSLASGGDADMFVIKYADNCATVTATPTPTLTPTLTLTLTRSLTPTRTRTFTPTPTFTATHTHTVVFGTPTPTQTVTRTVTLTPTITPTPDSFFPDDTVLTGGTGNEEGRSSCTDSLGNIYVAVLEWDDGCTCYVIYIYKYLPDGTLDLSFGTGGKMKCPGVDVHYSWNDRLEIKCDIYDRPVIVAYTDPCGGTCADMIIYRCTTGGSIDTTFNGTGYRICHNISWTGQSFGYGLDFDSTGKIVCIGRAWNGTTYDMIIVKCNEDGTIDTTFGTGGCVKYTSPVGDACGLDIKCRGGKMYSIGYVDEFDVSCSCVVRVMYIWCHNEDGTVDTTFGTGGCTKYVNVPANHKNCIPTKITITTGGKIVVIGSVDDGTGCEITCKSMIIWVFNIDGTFDTSFDFDGMLTSNPTGQGSCGNDVIIDNGGYIIGGGTIYNGLNKDMCVWKYDFSGNIVPGFGGGTGRMIYDTGNNEECWSVLELNLCRKIASGYTYNGLNQYDVILWNIEDMCPPHTETVTYTITPTTTRSLTPTMTMTQAITPTPTPTNSPEISSLCWVDADGTGQESMLVLSNSGISEASAICLDNSGNPHIAWSDRSEVNYEIYYLKWNGTAWVDVDGAGQESINVSNTTGESMHVSMALDGSGNPHIAFQDNSSGIYRIYYLKWNGSAWTDADGAGRESIEVFNGTGGSLGPSLALDGSGNPHISWYDGSLGNSEIYYLKWNGTAWVDADGAGQEGINVSNNSGSSMYPSLALDSTGFPHIAWFDLTAGQYETYYLKWNGTAWVDADGAGQESVNVSNNAGDSMYASLSLDSYSNPNLAWTDNTSGNYEIYYLKWNGTAWVDADGTGQEGINVSNNSGTSTLMKSLRLDIAGNPGIAWYDLTDGQYEIYYLKWNGTSWVDVDGAGQENVNISDNSSASSGPRLVFDGSGNPHIAWNDSSSGSGDIYYLKSVCGTPVATLTRTRTVTPTVSPTLTCVCTTSYTYTPTFTATYTPTATITMTNTAPFTPTFTATATATVTVTPACSAATPQFSVHLVYNPEHLDHVVIEITSAVPLVAPPLLSIYPHGNTDNKDIVYDAVASAVPGDLTGTLFRYLYTKQTGWGDIDRVVVTGTDECGNTGTSAGSYTKETISKKDIIIFKNVINPEKDERCRIVFNAYENDNCTVKIYNKNAALIKTLFDGPIYAGVQGEVIWDGTNDAGQKVVSGIYFVVVQNDYYTAKEKIAVVH